MEFPYSLDDYVLDLKEYAYKHGLKSPSVVAHSFGARVVLKTAYNEPDFFNKLVLTGAAGLKSKKTLKKTVKKTTFKLLKKFVPREKLQAFYSSDYLALSPIMKESFIKIVSETLDYTLSEIKNQTLLVFGEKDRETPLYMANKFKKEIKDSKLIIIKNAGHFCFLEKPHTFNMEVMEFLLC